MKDTVISAHRKRYELWSLLFCFVIAFLMNVFAVIAYGGRPKEIVTSIGFIIITTVILYILWAIIRLIIWAISLLFRKKS